MTLIREVSQVCKYRPSLVYILLFNAGVLRAWTSLTCCLVSWLLRALSHWLRPLCRANMALPMMTLPRVRSGYKKYILSHSATCVCVLQPFRANKRACFNWTVRNVRSTHFSVSLMSKLWLKAGDTVFRTRKVFLVFETLMFWLTLILT